VNVADVSLPIIDDTRSAILSARARLEFNIQLPLNQPWQTSNSVSSS
jgi:hypothetical protein